MSEAIYFHVTLKPHLKHSGKLTGRRISFLAEIPLDAAKAAKQSSGDRLLLFEEAKRLVAALTSIAMIGQRRQSGEDEMHLDKARDYIERGGANPALTFIELKG